MNLNNLDFFERVYIVVKNIPFGKVTSYGAIANYLGSPQSSRVVGWAMNNSHSNNDIPAPVSYTHLTLPTNREV